MHTQTIITTLGLSQFIHLVLIFYVFYNTFTITFKTMYEVKTIFIYLGNIDHNQC